ncbi:pyridoxal reductase Plr1 [Lodderomyces elongisporus]|uniref:NADP-dependent oxidoreductase domain-containing protein n=1 Tax=Lodderomyces elongisporus (strain ATCC 11503 / CBS 2605 / JCM 1781 / NBRC 1676 / NRRL YB-4239) TaxID=379508 RepID=A5E6Z0_LODEL|nr:pyridoxal reductase Plr1 [Lodderomyces elongisporus]EDK47198.1 conserved hypothetical protein [Lodderomyces elongisporus NRRL YB-4239]WLF78731.1 pyridoxal reductase Plr1 [Lodderomyces elongisporus]
MTKAIEIPGKFGFGTMSMTWKQTPPPFEQSIETLQFVTSHPEFSTKLLNGGEFYGHDDANLKLLKEFVDQNPPELNKQLIISIKGGLDVKTLHPDGSKEGIAKSIENIVSYFPHKENRPVLIFEIARVDKKVPYEETIKYIQEYVEQGVIDGISLSEVGIESIRKAISVAPISCVELEFSLFAQDILNDGILEELSKHQIPVIAYSPLCRGILTDHTAKDPESFIEEIKKSGDIRSMLDKFNPDIFKENTPLLKAYYEFAHNVKNTSLESLALSWILKVSGQKNFGGIEHITRILPIPSGSTKQRVEANFGNIVDLSDADLEELDKITKKYPIKGHRYNAALQGTLNQ